MKFRRPSNNILQTDVESGLALLDPDTHTYFLLNATGAVVWHRLEVGASLEELCEELAGRFEVTKDACERDVKTLLDRMSEKGFVVAGDEGSD